MPGEYEEDNPLPGQKENHTFVTTFQPREQPSPPTPPGAQERIQKELNQVEKYLDLTKTAQTRQTPEVDNFPDENFTKTIKEQQAQYVMQTQFTPPTKENQRQEIEVQIESSPLAKLAQLKEENRLRRIMTHLDNIKQHLTLEPTVQLPPTLPKTPLPKVS
jgi:hypothetical protein